MSDAELVQTDDEPVACDLDATAFEDRADRWRRVLGAAQRRDLLADGVQVRFPGSGGLRRALRVLVEAERACCGWATWTLQDAGPGIVTLEVRTDSPEGIRVLHGWLGSPRRAPEGAGSGDPTACP